MKHNYPPECIGIFTYRFLNSPFVNGRYNVVGIKNDKKSVTVREIIIVSEAVISRSAEVKRKKRGIKIVISRSGGKGCAFQCVRGEQGVILGK